jgi:DNA polymerase-3 subunit epsilon
MGTFLKKVRVGVANTQLDMFGRPRGSCGAISADEMTNLGEPSQETLNYEEMARTLESSGLYRISRKLLRPTLVTVPRPGFPRVGLVVDTETTGLNHQTDKVIEIGVVAFTYNDEGNLGDVVGAYSGLQDPGMAIPEEIVQLTGITSEMLRGQKVDLLALEKLVSSADIVIAHNAGFDRPFCEAVSSLFEQKAWACSVKEIDWKRRGFAGTKLGYLVGQFGLFHEGHRAIDDCYALFEILARTATNGTSPAFSELLVSSRKNCVRIWADNSPFEMKDKLKARRYRWSDGTEGRPKAWWIEINAELVEEELKFLRNEIYGREEAMPTTNLLSAIDRYKS